MCSLGFDKPWPKPQNLETAAWNSRPYTLCPHISKVGRVAPYLRRYPRRLKGVYIYAYMYINMYTYNHSLLFDFNLSVCVHIYVYMRRGYLPGWPGSWDFKGLGLSLGCRIKAYTGRPWFLAWPSAIINLQPTNMYGSIMFLCSTITTAGSMFCIYSGYASRLSQLAA